MKTPHIGELVAGPAEKTADFREPEHAVVDWFVASSVWTLLTRGEKAGT